MQRNFKIKSDIQFIQKVKVNCVKCFSLHILVYHPGIYSILQTINKIVISVQVLSYVKSEPCV